ncbi:transcriptional regulator, GntR family [Thermodesulfobium narugense DSM 14796]|uniref:Transcriptional regulator, GntR family n=1 Tax=Thermodesulfobium narugense DSM 14796 TaxID=747365 RepID=M1E946_9BACT|nr:GntR family transcriptional regulator [Thermodesulfobium narugense]AEE14854.1 transcriptional regulator, GntR family [Thermodesulfobium narugense DSM 14796]
MPKSYKRRKHLLSDEAYEKLKKHIFLGKIKVGELETERGLAERFNMSRTPIREAILKLEKEGLVTVIPREGILIGSLNRFDLKEIFEIRRLLESFSAEKLARVKSDIDFSKLEKIIINARKRISKKNYVGFVDLDREFHSTIAELTKNRYVVRFLEDIRDVMNLSGIKALTKSWDYEQVLREHTEILDAMKKKDPSSAKKAMDKHLLNTFKAMIRILPKIED